MISSMNYLWYFIKYKITHLFHPKLKEKLGISFGENQILFPAELLENVNVPSRLLGVYEKKGRVKLSHRFTVTAFNPFNDTVAGYITYVDTDETTTMLHVPVEFLEAFFKRLPEEYTD